MSYDPKNTMLEERVARLEAVCKKQDKRIRAMFALFRQASSSPFDSPLDRFFDGPGIDDPIFDIEEEMECIERCAKAYRAAIKAADGDEAAETAAGNAFTICIMKCRRWGFPRF